jgi:dTDP-4-amino-4,6-dideoxygalactose transaminase
VAGEPIPLFRSFVAPDAAAALAAALAEATLASGPGVAEFEAALAHRLGAPHVVVTADRAGALTLALRRCGVGPGTEVLLSPLSCLATTMPIAALHATPVWCDVDPATGMLDPAEVARRRSSRTRAVVHYLWGGDVGPLAELQAVADAAGLPLVVDAATAFGARHRELAVGATGNAFTVLSFYAVNLPNTVEGGALCCAREEDATQARWLRRFGIHQPSFRTATGDLNPASDIPHAGYSAAMTNLTARLGLCQLAAVEPLLARHAANGLRLEAELADVPGLTSLARAPHEQSAFWVYALRAQRRAELLARLHAAGIGAQRLHLRNDRYSCFAPAPWPLPGVDAFDADNLALPCGWWVGTEERERIVTCVRRGW